MGGVWLQGLAWRGAKDFNDAYKERRYQRLAGHKRSAAATVDELFSGEHVMHPGLNFAGSGAVSAAYSTQEMNPHGQATTAALHYRDPGAVRQGVRALAGEREQWLRGEQEDMAAVVSAGELSREGMAYAHSSLGLGGSSGGGGGGSGAANPPARGRRGAGQLTAMGTTFKRRADRAYESSSRAHYTTFAAHDRAAAAAAEAIVARGGPRAAFAPPGGWPSAKTLGAVQLGNGPLLANPLRAVSYGEFTLSAGDLPHARLAGALHPVGDAQREWAPREGGYAYQPSVSLGKATGNNR